MIVILILILISLIYYINFRRSRKPLYELADTLPNPGQLPILGHAHWFTGGPEKILNNIKVLADMMDKAGGICKVWIGSSLYVVTFQPEDVQTILQSCLEKAGTYIFLKPWLGNGLFAAPVELWKAHRRLLLPEFRSRALENFIDVFGEQGEVLVKRLREHDGKSTFDVYKYICSCMLDIFFQTTMGEKMNAQYNPNSAYLTARSWCTSIINLRVFKVWLQPDFLFKLSPYYKKLKENIAVSHKFTDEVILAKRKLTQNDKSNGNNTEGHKDILENILRKNTNFTNEELREHLDSITIAGNDTTALVISYVLVLLGCHQGVQEKVYEEIKNIFGDSMRHPTKEDINKLEYLERVIKETMRLYAVVPLISRKTQSEIKLSSCTLPAGVGCAVLPFIIHRLKSIWGPDADDFDPDRFLPENCAKRHPCSFIPFSFGARNCIGRQYGMIVMKSVLATFIRSYKITSNQCNRLKIVILLYPVDGHLISIEKRTK